MNIENIKLAQAIAKRFLYLSEVVVMEAWSYSERPNKKLVSPGKNAAALKRTSLDLTRALAEMRKP